MPSDYFLYCWVKNFEVPMLQCSNLRTLTSLTFHFATVFGPAVSRRPKVVLLDIIFPVLTQSWNECEGILIWPNQLGVYDGKFSCWGEMTLLYIALTYMQDILYQHFDVFYFFLHNNLNHFRNK